MEEARQLVPRWDIPLIAASIGISLLGAFTSTQLVCQAKTSRYFTGVLVWMVLGSLTFGFCSIWSLHEVAMLAYELDIRIDIDVGLTVLSAVLAVGFTFFALAPDLLYHRYSKQNRKLRLKPQRRWRTPGFKSPKRHSSVADGGSSEPLLAPSPRANGHAPTSEQDLERNGVSLLDAQERPSIEANQNGTIDVATQQVDQPSVKPLENTDLTHQPRTYSLGPIRLAGAANEQTAQYTASTNAGSSEFESEVDAETVSYQDTLSLADESRLSSFGESTASTFGLGGIMSMNRYTGVKTISANPFVAVYGTLSGGLSIRTIVKGFFWAIAITSMHYVGIRALIVPHGYVTLNPFFVGLSGVICWVVCVVGCILILEIETHLGQQLLFSAVATCGVAAMHFTGMRAATFYSYEPPSSIRGYPPGLATAIAVVAISTCIAANLLLAHSATVSRNKLAEIFWTRRKLWMAIAQKEAAETTAAARSDFIASASHEIRTPLHHLQGYSDLLSQTQLTDEGRLLLHAIQRATKTLSLITNNVLDWSRLERDGEATCLPVSLDLRTTCESIITLLPNQDEEVDVDLMVVVSPDVPRSLFIDETYIHRILMNLLSNALKFTSSGYILLLVEMRNDNVVVSVTDTGCGVPPSFIPQLFEPFKQAQTRGRARGTGLGLSIIKQLLQKLEGSIKVESQFQDDEDVGPERSGSTFTITIPVQPSAPPQPEQDNDCHKIVIIPGDSNRTLKGLRTAWEKFGFQVEVAARPSDISDADQKYIWADLERLQEDPQLLPQLAKHTQCTVLIPFTTRSSLQEVSGLAQAPAHIVPIQKPLIWHTIQKQIAAANLHYRKSHLSRTVRFDSVVTDLGEPQNKEERPHQPVRQVSLNSFAEEQSVVEAVVKKPLPKDLVVLLVEDNPINCKLGSKMLRSLGYRVLIAEDGVLAIEQITLHDAEVDAILMDQSMPRKDGLTATKEIRALEANGTLSRTRPIIALSAVVSDEAQNLFKLAGANDFLAKPLSLSKLEQTLATHLRWNTEATR